MGSISFKMEAKANNITFGNKTQQDPQMTVRASLYTFEKFLKFSVHSLLVCIISLKILSSW